MELRNIADYDYHSFCCTIKPGKTTAGKDISEEEKERMLTTWPQIFEVVAEEVVEKGITEAPIAEEAPVEAEVAEEVVIETPEAKLVIETPEAKMPKSRKK